MTFQHTVTLTRPFSEETLGTFTFELLSDYIPAIHRRAAEVAGVPYDQVAILITRSVVLGASEETTD